MSFTACWNAAASSLLGSTPDLRAKLSRNTASILLTTPAPTPSTRSWNACFSSKKACFPAASRSFTRWTAAACDSKPSMYCRTNLRLPSDCVTILPTERRYLPIRILGMYAPGSSLKFSRNSVAALTRSSWENFSGSRLSMYRVVSASRYRLVRDLTAPNIVSTASFCCLLSAS